MLNNFLKILSSWQEFKINLQHFKLYCNAFYFNVNDNFQGEIDSNGSILMKSINAEITENLNLKIHKNSKINVLQCIEIDGIFILDHLVLRNKNKELYKIFIDENGKLNSALV